MVESRSFIAWESQVDVRIVQVEVDLGGVPIVRGISLDVREGEIAGVVGPNGSGKSTLLRTLYRYLRPRAGHLVVGGDDLWRLTARENARRVAAVPQERADEFDFTVREVVGLGRLPHAGSLGKPSDRSPAVDDAMARTGVADLATRPFATLSGGERQRVLVARTLAQEAPVVVLDEPTNHLDIRHQIELMELLRELRLTTLMAIHDLNLAATYCDTVHVLQGGRVVASGAPLDVLTPDLVERVFEVSCSRHVEPTGTLRLTFGPRAPRPAGVSRPRVTP